MHTTYCILTYCSLKNKMEKLTNMTEENVSCKSQNDGDLFKVSIWPTGFL